MQGDRQLPSLPAPAPSRPTHWRPTLGRRTILKGALGGAAALGLGQSLAACSDDSGGGGSASGGKAVVRMWSWYNDQEDQFPKLIEKFEASHSNIKVENGSSARPTSIFPPCRRPSPAEMCRRSSHRTPAP